MKYSKSDFDRILTELTRRLCEDAGDPLPCKLYDFTKPNNGDQATTKDGAMHLHVADACNLASSIQGLYRLLSLAKDDTDCEQLSRVVVRELSALREAVQSALEEQIFYERNEPKLRRVSGFSAKPAEKSIRLWADVLKHPAATILAHQCFDHDDGPEKVIDTAELRNLEKNAIQICKDDSSVNHNMSKAWAKVWMNYSGKTVQFDLPNVDEIIDFLVVIADRVENLIDRRQKIQTSDC